MLWVRRQLFQENVESFGNLSLLTHCYIVTSEPFIFIILSKYFRIHGEILLCSLHLS